MGRVCENLKIVGLRGSTEVKALFDTGASRTFLHGDVAEKIGYTRFPEPREVSTAAKGKKLIIVGMAFFETEINGCKVPWSPAYVSPELVEEMVVGIDLVKAHSIKIDPKKGKLDASGFIELTILASILSFRKEDPLITRYCILLGMNDLLCLYSGNYDKYSYVTGRWTELKTIDNRSYLFVEPDKRNIPTIGANGSLVRTEALQSIDYRSYLFDQA